LETTDSCLLNYNTEVYIQLTHVLVLLINNTKKQPKKLSQTTRFESFKW